MATKRQTPKIKIDFCEDGASSGNTEVKKSVEKMCVNKLELKYKSERHRNYSCALREAVMTNEPDEIPRIVREEGIEVSEMSKSDVPLIHEAAFEGRLECVRALLDCGAKIDTVDSEDWTALHAAVLGGHVELVRLLIHKGADLYAETIDKYIPFHIAIEKRDEDMIALLVEEMAQISAFKGKELHKEEL